MRINIYFPFIIEVNILTARVIVEAKLKEASSPRRRGSIAYQDVIKLAVDPLDKEKESIGKEMQVVETAILSLSRYMQTVPPQTLGDSMIMLNLTVEALEIKNNIAVKQLILVAQQVIATHTDI